MKFKNISLLTASGVSLLLFSGCMPQPGSYGAMQGISMNEANMINMREDRINDINMPQEYKDMKQFQSDINQKLTIAKVSNCKFSNKQWSKKVQDGSYKYFGTCDKDGLANGVGGLFEVNSSKKTIDKWSFSKGKFPIYVGGFSKGKMDGKGYLTQKSNYKDIVEFDVKAKKEFYNTNPKAKEMEERQAQGTLSMKDRMSGKKPDILANYKKQKLNFSAGPGVSGGVNMLGINYGGKAKKVTVSNSPIILNIPSYFGDFQNGKKSGIGIEFNKNSRISFIGSFKDNKKTGMGTKYMPEYDIFKFIPRESIKKTNNPIVKIKSNFKNGVENDATTLIFANCKKMVTSYKNGKINFPAKIYEYEPTTASGKAVQGGRISMSNITTIYGYERFATYDKNYKPTNGEFYSYTQDDDKYTTFRGTLDKNGEYDGVITAIVKIKQPGDITNKRHFSIAVGDDPIEVYKALYSHGKFVKNIEARTKFDSLNDAYKRIKGGLAILQGASPISPVQVGKIAGNTWNKLTQSGDISKKCKDLNKFGKDADMLVERYNNLKKAVKYIK